MIRLWATRFAALRVERAVRYERQAAELIEEGARDTVVYAVTNLAAKWEWFMAQLWLAIAGKR